MNTNLSPVMLAVVGAVLWFLAGFVQGGMRTSADPELVIGFAELFRALGWVAIIAAGLGLARRA